MPRAIDPISITLSDGQERKFLLTMGGLRRVKSKLGVTTLKDVLSRDIEASGVPILFEALLDKGALTEDQFADLLPAKLDSLARALGELLTASMPDPPKPTPTATVQ